MLQDLLQQKQENEQLEFEKEQARRKAEIEKFAKEVGAVLGEALVELDPKYGWQRGPFVNLYHRGSVKTFCPNTWANDALNLHNVLTWVELVDEEYLRREAQWAEARPRIVAALLELNVYDAKNLLRQYKRNDPEIETLMEVAELELKRRREDQAAKEAIRVEAEVREAIQALDGLDDYEKVREIRDSVSYNAHNNVEFTVAVQRAFQRAEDKETREEDFRRESLKRVEAELFHPFVVYRVTYPVVASEGGETFVEKESFWSADCCPTDGWWKPLNGNPLCLPYPPLMEKFEINSVEDYPKNWPLWNQTEYGWARRPV